MKKNIGTTDRLIRLSLGIIFLALAWWQSSWILLGIASFIFFEVIASWCVFYQLIGKNSCPINQDKN